MLKSLKVCLTLFVFISVLSCKNTIPIEKNQYLLWSNDFKGNKTFTDEDLISILPFSQRANTRPLNLPITPKVWWYNIGKRNFNNEKHLEKLKSRKNKLDLIQKSEKPKAEKIEKLLKKIDRSEQSLNEGVAWFWRNVGEKQVLIRESEIVETENKLKKFLVDKGFRDAEVKGGLTFPFNSNQASLSFLINENEPYLVDSVIYVSKDDSLINYLNRNKENSLMKRGDRLDLSVVQSEKARLEQILKSEGYFEFNQKYLSHGVSNASGSEDEFKRIKRGNLILEVILPNNSNFHQKYRLSEVVFKTFDPNTSLAANSKIDTVDLDGVRFISLNNVIPIDKVRKHILTSPKEFYNINAISSTQQQLSYFNQFAFASTQVKKVGTELLSLEYFAPLLQKYTLGISPGINNIYSDGSTFFGFGVPVSIISRNKFRKLETIELSARASYEGQPSPLNAGNSAIRGSLELGLNLNLTLPDLWPFKFNDAFRLKNPRTIMGLGYSYSEPFWGQRQNFKINSNYSIQLSKYKTLFFSLLDVNLINTLYAQNESGREFYNSLLSLAAEGNNLKVTFDPQFVSSINANYIYNNQNLSKAFSSSKFLRIFVESGGTVLNLLSNKDRIGFVESTFPLSGNTESTDSLRSYFRFLKLNIDARKNINLSKSSSYAFRVNLGLVNPYGKNRSLPYDKNFFIGGSNSVRAWAPRTLGTGSALADTTGTGATIPQPGDVLLESSIEYRKRLFHFAGEIQMAAFLDAGNIWKWHQQVAPNKKDAANFSPTRFMKEIALGTGLGIRWDLEYFLFRFDWGIKVFDPSRSEGERFVLDEFTFRRRNRYGLTWNFGIGYPF